MNTPSTPSPALHVRALHFAYPALPPLFENWSATLAPGLSVLSGDDSTGKTTLLRLLAGELQGRGQVTLIGRPLAATDVFWQDPRAEPGASLVADYLQAQARRWPAWDEAAAQRHIDGLSLREHLHKPFYALSTGGRRKVWLTAALASQAMLTLIDEPLAALDTPSIRYLLQALQMAATAAPRWVLVAHWEALPGVPPERLLDLGA